jgi:hypothetical protein
MASNSQHINSKSNKTEYQKRSKNDAEEKRREQLKLLSRVRLTALESAELKKFASRLVRFENSAKTSQLLKFT